MKNTEHAGKTYLGKTEEAALETVAAFASGAAKSIRLDMKSSQTQISLAEPGDYLALMKPRVMSLVVFTALVGLIAAQSTTVSSLPLWSAFAAILAIAVGAGASGALNMWYDADIDAKMTRTRKRPIPRGVIAPESALIFGLMMSGFAVWTLSLATNWLAGALLALTIVYYLFVYTIGLKRRTPQNIVIGGAAGAFPPVIGWAAVTGSAPLEAWVLFLIIFLWTPPHFWALALYKAGDYGKVGIPMMPNIRGAASTRRQIFAYTLALVLISLVPIFIGLSGAIYALAAALLGIGFIFLSFKVWRSKAGERLQHVDEASLYAVQAGNRAARNLFAYSIIYLFALFGALAADSLLLGAPI